jgi:CubicO group peptidase (beta-lactamase class C family)
VTAGREIPAPKRGFITEGWERFGVSDQATGLSTETVTSIESQLTDWMSEDRVAGASLAVVRDGQTVYSQGFGSRNLAENDPATPETLYGIGSCSKSFTALAVCQLAEAGDLDLEDPVDEYIPHLSGVEGDPVTIHDLLSHSSGMPSDGNLTALITRLTGVENVEVPLGDDDDFRRHVQGSTDERMTDEERFFYYNAGFTMLGLVVEAASGQDYPEYVREHIHDPLSMDRSGFSEEAFEADDDAMTAYYRDDGDSEPSKLPFDERLYAPGGMYSSVEELGNYLRMYLNDGTFEGEEVVSGESLDAMQTPHATRDEYIDGTAKEYGYGLAVREYLGETLVGHGGMMGTTTAYFGFLPESDVGVAIGCNTAPDRHPTVAGLATLAVLQGADPTETVPRLALDEKFDALTGEYESYRGIWTGSVERSGGRLEITLGGIRSEYTMALFPADLNPESYDFYTVTSSGQRVPVQFHVDGDDVSVTYQRWRLHRQ